VLNILRARDKAPLHFSDIPLIHESMQQTNSLGLQSFFGAQHANTQRDFATFGGSFQISPSFDLAHLDSKDFVTGIASPIDPKFVKYWLDRGLDRRIILLLFFSAAEIVETNSGDSESTAKRAIRIANAPRDAIERLSTSPVIPADTAEGNRCDLLSDFERYLKLVNALQTFFAHAYTERREIASFSKSELNLKDISTLDPAKFQLAYDQKNSNYKLYAVSAEQKIAYCFYEDQEGEVGSLKVATAQLAGKAPGGTEKICYMQTIDAPMATVVNSSVSERSIFFAGPAKRDSPSTYCSIFNDFVRQTIGKTIPNKQFELRLHIRSVGEIFQFLGDLLQYQDEVRKYQRNSPNQHIRLNTPVTFGYCADDPQEKPRPRCNDIFFTLREESCNARFTLSYRGKDYSVAGFNSPNQQMGQGRTCSANGVGQSDHTLEILSVVHQLVDLNRSATDIRSTPIIQVVP
jgi:hypothetical protein